MSNAGQFESARSGFADYARDGDSAKELRAWVNWSILEDLEQKEIALRALLRNLATSTRESLSGTSWHKEGRGPGSPAFASEGFVFEF